MNKRPVSSLEVILQLVPETSWREFSLSTEEAFVMSLVNDRLTVREMIETCGLGEKTTVDVLYRLYKIGLIALDSENKHPTFDSVDQPSSESSQPKIEVDVKMLQKRPQPKKRRTTTPEVAATVAADLDEELQRTINRKYNEIKFCSARIFLELPESYDEEALRASFLRLSKAFHPDRYFNRNIGKYRTRVTKIFEHLTRCHDLLLQGLRHRPPVVKKEKAASPSPRVKDATARQRPAADESKPPFQLETNRPPEAAEPPEPDPRPSSERHDTLTQLPPFEPTFGKKDIASSLRVSYANRGAGEQSPQASFWRRTAAKHQELREQQPKDGVANGGAVAPAADEMSSFDDSGPLELGLHPIERHGLRLFAIGVSLMLNDERSIAPPFCKAAVAQLGGFPYLIAQIEQMTKS
ncbi:MAG: hypothetical protein KC609_03700 [Myxococcales bacterium]|nr:hypothetical protein [Myxococcales bacterium]